MPATIPDWLFREVEEYRLPFITPPKSIADIGANIGAFTIMAKNEWPRARVKAFEPFDDNYVQLRRNLRGIPGVTAVCAAVRDFSGSDNIYAGDMGVTCSFHQLGRQTGQRRKVACKAASSLGRFEFVKIDTEGCELEILRSLDLSETKAVALEYHRRSDIAKLKRVAAERGFGLWAERPDQSNVGILIFARPNVFVAPPPVKLFVALPCYGSMPSAFVRSLLRLTWEPPVSLVVKQVVGDSLVPRARNNLTADFLESDCTHMLSIDTDLIHSCEQVARMIAHDEQIVGGFYPKKQDGPLHWVCNVFPKSKGADKRGLQSLRYIGTGFMLVKREVFETMIEALGDWPRFRYKSDETGRIEHDLWPVGVYPGTSRYLSEDWYFCQRALDLGYKVYGDTRVILKHVGNAIYPLQSQEAALTNR